MKDKILITVIVILLILAIVQALFSCDKLSFTSPIGDSLVAHGSIPAKQILRSDSSLFMNVLMYTRDAYLKHDAHSYAEGHILEFHTDWKRQRSVNGQKMRSALTYMQHAITNSGTNTFGHDTTGQYLNLFTYVMASSAYMDTYPDSALIFSPVFPEFKTWYISTCNDWMINHKCTGINQSVDSPNSFYIIKIRCTP